MTVLLTLLLAGVVAAWSVDCVGRTVTNDIPLIQRLIAGTLELAARRTGGTVHVDTFPLDATHGRPIGAGKWHVYWRSPTRMHAIWVESSDPAPQYAPVLTQPTRPTMSRFGPRAKFLADLDTADLDADLAAGRFDDPLFDEFPFDEFLFDDPDDTAA